MSRVETFVELTMLHYIGHAWPSRVKRYPLARTCWELGLNWEVVHLYCGIRSVSVEADSMISPVVDFLEQFANRVISKTHVVNHQRTAVNLHITQIKYAAGDNRHVTYHFVVGWGK